MKKIAEIGLNHCGDIDSAQTLLYKLLETDVDGITLQIREEEFYEKFPHLKLPIGFYLDVYDYCMDAEKEFGIAICDSYYDDLPVHFWKTLGKDMNDHEFLKKLKDKPLYVSTADQPFEKIQNMLAAVSPTTIIHTTLKGEPENARLFWLEVLRRYHHSVAFGLHAWNPAVTYAALAFQPDALFFYVKEKDGCPDDKHAIPLDEVTTFLRNVEDVRASIGR